MARPSAPHLGDQRSLPEDEGVISASVFTLAALSGHKFDNYVEKPIRVASIIVVALVLRAIAGRTIKRLVQTTREGRISRRIAILGERAPLLVDTSELAVARRHQRAATVGTVLRSIANMIIGTIAVITILGEFEINLAPIIASAGIVGVAVGFGAQNLVKDFLSGLFLVIEDTYGVGDTVDLGPATGTVETVGLRSTRIRDVQGTLWSIRNGEISRVANYSQTWQRFLLDLLILHGQDVDKAREVVLAEAIRVAELPQWEGVTLDPPTVWGVQAIQAEGVVLRLAVRRRHNHDDFDRYLREHVVKALDGAGVRIFLLPADIRLVGAGDAALAQLDLGRHD
jgi:small-conductance mechanosensitive channel